jgi:hypothetical protein
VTDPAAPLAHPRHFTRQEANASLPTLRPLLERLREARDLLTDAEAHEALSEAAPGNGGGEPAIQVSEGFVEVRYLLSTLQDAGIVIRDIDRGLIDFHGLMDGREIYLCWDFDDEAVDFWHELEAGYGGRRPLD